MALFLRVLGLTLFLCVASGARQLSSLLRSSHAGSSSMPKDQREFDYFMFVRQWAGQYCSTHECPLVTDRSYHFTIHGLWPNYDDGTWPQFCNADYKFDEDQLKDLMDEMEEEWPSVQDSDETFWEHEWSKHGTCALDVFPTEHSYFKHVLKLHLRYDLAAALRPAGIVPSRNRVYRAQDVRDALYKAFGVRVLIHCYNKQLSEIWMCFDKDLQPFNCDTSHETGRCDEMTIPPFKSQSLRGGAVADADVAALADADEVKAAAAAEAVAAS